MLNCRVGVDVRTQTFIARPPSEVSHYASDPSNAPAWYRNIRSVEWANEPIVRVGARVAFVARFLGRTLSYTYEITEFEPGVQMVMKTAQGPFPMETVYTWSAISGGTQMQLINRGEPSGFSKLAAPMMSRAMRRANEKDLAALKEILERDSAPRGP